MSVNDLISDMLTRIRNAGMARKPEVLMPSTKVLVRNCPGPSVGGVHRRVRSDREGTPEPAQDHPSLRRR